MVDVIIGLAIVGILAAAGFAVYKAKKNGKKCMGCPDSCACSGSNCAGGCKNCQK